MTHLFLLLKIKSESEKQFWFYKTIVYRPSGSFPGATWKQTIKKLIPESERVIIHGAQACQVSKLMILLYKKQRAGRDGWGAHVIVQARSREEPSSRETTDQSSYYIYIVSVTGDALNSSTPRLNTRNQLIRLKTWRVV